MADKTEKRIKLGVDVGELANQLIQINNLTEKNYNLSVDGQSKYNKLIQDSLDLLDQQAKKLKVISEQIKDISDNYSSFPNSSFTISNDREEDRNSSSFFSENSTFEKNHFIDNVFTNNKFEGNFFGESNLNNNSEKNNQKQNDYDLNNQNQKQNDYHRELLAISTTLVKINSDSSNLYDLIEDLKTTIEEIRDSSNTPPTPIPNPIPPNPNGGGNNGNQVQNGIPNSNNGGGNSLANSAGNSFNRGASIVAGSKNDLYIATSLIGMIPIIGAGLQALLNRMLQAGESLDDARHKFRASSGRFGSANFESIGLSSAEAFEKQAQYIKSNANLGRNDILFEKGFNLNSGTLSSLLESTRRDRLITSKGREAKIENGGYTASGIGINYLNSLTSSIPTKEVRAYSEDYLRILVDLNQKQLEEVGETNASINGGIIASIASLGDKLENPRTLSQVINGLKSGLTQANSPQLEALQYYTLSQINPNASLWDLQRMRENPFAKENLPYMRDYILNLMSIGNEDEAKFNVMSAFGLTANQTEELINGINTNLKKSKGQSIFDVNYGNKPFSIGSEASAATSAMQRRTARTEDWMGEKGISLQNKILGPAVDWVENNLDQIIKDPQGYALKTLGEIGSYIKSLVPTVEDIKDAVIHGGVSKETRERVERQTEEADIATLDFLIKNEKNPTIKKGYEAERAKIIANKKNRK